MGQHSFPEELLCTHQNLNCTLCEDMVLCIEQMLIDQGSKSDVVETGIRIQRCHHLQLGIVLK